MVDAAHIKAKPPTPTEAEAVIVSRRKRVAKLNECAAEIDKLVASSVERGPFSNKHYITVGRDGSLSPLQLHDDAVVDRSGEQVAFDFGDRDLCRRCIVYLCNVIHKASMDAPSANIFIQETVGAGLASYRHMLTPEEQAAIADFERREAEYMRELAAAEERSAKRKARLDRAAIGGK